jgi:peptidoglycan/xylan/chitin deacetylase (PgdA/CDA1 family)
MVIGLGYHGSTATRLSGLDNVWGKHIDAATFEAQLAFLTSHYRVITVSEVVAALREHKPLPRKSVFLTFDDGYRGNYEVAFPLLKKYGARASFYVATSYLETGRRYPLDVIDAALKYTTKGSFTLPNASARHEPISVADPRAPYLVRDRFKTLDEHAQNDFVEAFAKELGFTSTDDVPPLGQHAQFMSWAELREMRAAGMEIGSHSHRHLILARVTPEVARTELATSKRELESHLEAPCEQFCYPNGHFPADANDATDELVKTAGYSCALYLTGRTVTRHTNRYRLHRRGVGIETSIRELAAICAALGDRVRGNTLHS